MSKENILDFFLSKKNVSFKELKKTIIQAEKGILVYIYLSHFENLGNGDSDLDVYAFLEDDRYKKEFQNKKSSTKILCIGDLEIDIEYRSLTSFFNLQNNTSTKENLKILSRIPNSICIVDEDIKKKIDNYLVSINIAQAVERYYSYAARSLYDDALKMLSNGELNLAYECLRTAIINEAGAINAIKKSPNLKEKWIHKIFLRHKYFDNENLLNKYNTYIIYPVVTKNNKINILNEMIDFYQEMVAEVAFSN